MVEGWTFVTAVKPPLEIHPSHTEFLRMNLTSPFDSGFLPMHTLGSRSDVCSHVGDPHEVQVSGVIQKPKYGVSEAENRSFLSVSLLLKYSLNESK